MTYHLEATSVPDCCLEIDHQVVIAVVASESRNHLVSVIADYQESDFAE